MKERAEVHAWSGGRARGKQVLAALSVLAGFALASTKLVVGLLTGSLGILAEALHSLFDLGASLITFFSVRISSRPADEDHLYGHGKVENISALVQAFLLLATCVWVVREAVARLSGRGAEIDASLWAFVVMGFSVIVAVAISRLLYRGARKYGSQALEADGLHYASDILSSCVVIVGRSWPPWRTSRGTPGLRPHRRGPAAPVASEPGGTGGGRTRPRDAAGPSAGRGP